jgi:hypothetical protein
MRNLAAWLSALVLPAACLAGQKQMDQLQKAQFDHKETTATRELAPERYEKLRLGALSLARVKVFSKLSKSSLSESGVDWNMMAALDQQRAYLLERAPLASDPPQAAQQNNGTFVPSLAAAPRSKSALADVPVWTGISMASTCKSPQIRSVNGKAQNAVFTPRLPDNVYRIEGCMFGRVPGQIQLEPHPTSREQTALPIRLRLKPVANSWSDSQIDVYLDDHLSGVSDTPVTLVIFPGKGQRVELRGCFFVARRGEPKLLHTIPASWVKLEATTTTARGIRQLEYVSSLQAREGIPNDASGTSALILRSDSTPFESGTDVFELSRLNSGWRVESVQLQHYVVSCPGDVVQAKKSGQWATAWTHEGVKVKWAAESCRSYIPPQFKFELSTSLYALKIWVVGPAGTEPIRTK